MRAIFFGLLASSGMLAFYVLILTVANSFSHALEQFLILWYLMTPLIALFGVQVGLFAYMRERARIGKASFIASGGASGGAMIACCLHHATDVLPIIGLSGLAAIFTAYQTTFLLFGIVAGSTGLLWMLSVMQRNGLYSDTKVWTLIMRYDLRTATYAMAFFGVLTTGIVTL